MSYWLVGIITVLAFTSGYFFAIHTLSKRVCFNRFIILERLFLASRDFYQAKTFEDIEAHGDRVRKLVVALGGKL